MDKNGFGKVVSFGALGSKENGEITGVFRAYNNHYIIMENAIYELQEREKYDPENTNPNLPDNVKIKIFNKGSNDEIVARTIFQASKMFGNGFLKSDIDTSRLFRLVLDILYEFEILEKEVAELLRVERELIEEDLKCQDNSIPPIGNAHTRCKTVFQKADHIQQIINDVVLIFYPRALKKKHCHFETVLEFLKSLEPNPDFLKKLEEKKNFMALNRALRDALDHRIDKVIVNDFYLTKSSIRMRPAISLLKFHEQNLPTTDLSKIFPRTLDYLISVVETMIVLLIDSKLKESSEKMKIKKIPSEIRENQYMNYGYWSHTPSGGVFVVPYQYNHPNYAHANYPEAVSAAILSNTRIMVLVNARDKAPLENLKVEAFLTQDYSTKRMAEFSHSVPDHVWTINHLKYMQPAGILQLDMKGVNEYSIKIIFETEFKKWHQYFRIKKNNLGIIKFLRILTDENSRVISKYIDEEFPGIGQPEIVLSKERKINFKDLKTGDIFKE